MESHVSEPGGLGDSGIEMYKLGSHLHTDILHSLAGRSQEKFSSPENREYRGHSVCRFTGDILLSVSDNFRMCPTSSVLTAGVNGGKHR